MSFGLTNAPSTFMSLMNEVFKTFLNLFVIVFIDNILVYSKSIEDHPEHLYIILDILRSRNCMKNFISKNSDCPMLPSEGMLFQRKG